MKLRKDEVVVLVVLIVEVDVKVVVVDVLVDVVTLVEGNVMNEVVVVVVTDGVVVAAIPRLPSTGEFDDRAMAATKASRNINGRCFCEIFKQRTS